MGRKKSEINLESGKRLKQWLHDQHITAKFLCEKIGYTPQYISDVIRGKKPLTTDLAKRIENASLEIPIDERVRAEWLLCEDNFETVGDRVDAITIGTQEVYGLIENVMKLHGYEIIADTFDYEPPDIDMDGRELQKVHYGIKSRHVRVYIGADEIGRLLREIDEFIEFKCLTALDCGNGSEMRNRIAQNWKDRCNNG